MEQIQKIQEAEDHQFVHYQKQLLMHKEQQRMAAQKSNSANNEPTNKERNNEVLTLNQKILDLEQQLLSQQSRPQHQAYDANLSLKGDRKTISNVATNSAAIAYLTKNVENMNKQFSSLAEFVNKNTNKIRKKVTAEDELLPLTNKRTARRKRTHPYHQQQTDEPIEYEDPYYPDEKYYRSTKHKYCDK